uniref:Staygreen protein domain-containing protein n=1 Tax=Opuntia streptacantha TaxID=393608 RepID=A0A7C8YUY2_OPUST
MASNCACSFSLSPYSKHSSKPISKFLFSRRPSSFSPLILSSISKVGAPHKNALISEAVRLLGPPARFEASKLKVDFMGEQLDKCSTVVPRIYILSHCDFTANLTLTVSNIITVDQLQGWYSKDDVVVEWKDMKGKMSLVVHCYVSGPNNFFVDLAAEFRYHIFSKELPLVLQAVLYGDSALFKEHPELMDAVVWVYFHSMSPKYNCIECWGPLKDAAQKGDQIHGSLSAKEQDSIKRLKLESPKSFFQALFTFLL